MTNETTKPVAPAQDLKAAATPVESQQAASTVPTAAERYVLEHTRGGSYDMKGMG